MLQERLTEEAVRAHRRPGLPAPEAPAYVFRASEQAGSVTAEVVDAAGGTPLP